MPNPELEKFRQQNPQLSDKGAKDLEAVRNQTPQATPQNVQQGGNPTPEHARAGVQPNTQQPQVNPDMQQGANAAQQQTPNTYDQQQSGNPEMAKAQAQAREAMANRDNAKDQVKEAEQQKDQEPER